VSNDWWMNSGASMHVSANKALLRFYNTTASKTVAMSD